MPSDPIEAVLVELTAAPPAELFEGLRSKAARLHAMQRFYAPRKAALIARLEALPGVSVDDLSSGATLIVRGPVGVIESLTARGGPLDADDLAVAPAELFRTP